MRSIFSPANEHLILDAGLTELVVVIRDNRPDAHLVVEVLGTYKDDTAKPAILAKQTYVTHGNPAAKAITTCFGYNSLLSAIVAISGQLTLARLELDDSDIVVAQLHEQIVDGLTELAFNRLVPSMLPDPTTD